MKNKRTVGTKYEQLAGRYLEEKGYQILEYNFRCRRGEIDLIALDGDTYVFVEVKYRSSTEQGYPEEAVDDKKQKTISRCAFYYLYSKNRMNASCRFDVISIDWQKISHIENAFDYCL